MYSQNNLHDKVFFLPRSIYLLLHTYENFPGSSDGNESTCNVGDPRLIFGWKMP